jgi:hypothetical protein
MSLPPILFSCAGDKWTDEWPTPRDFFAKLDRRYRFTLDPCATAENATWPGAGLTTAIAIHAPTRSNAALMFECTLGETAMMKYPSDVEAFMDRFVADNPGAGWRAVIRAFEQTMLQSMRPGGHLYERFDADGSYDRRK